jgi:hypothetical protein
MSAELVSVPEDESAERIAQLMETHAIRRVLVLSGKRLVGIVSRADLLRAVLRSVPSPESNVDDGALLRGVIAAMREQPWVDTFWVYPTVAAGIVTLYGYARSETMRQGLMVLAKGVPGVTAVRDKLDPMPLLLRGTF